MSPGLPKTRPAVDPLLGQQVLGYKLKRLIGKGGMGAVYEAEHPEIRQRSAVKVLFSEYSRDEEFVRRFVYEARAASQVQHPGLVKIYNHGQFADGTAFIMMEFLDGESLQARLARLELNGQKMPLASVVAIARQVVSALVAVHHNGIVHRDLKPANLLLIPSPGDRAGEQVKLVDFGIAKSDLDTAAEVSQTTVGRFLGTALYASPEQCQMAGKVGTRADVYSLGVVLYEMLAGKPPFVADQPGMVIGMHLFRQPVPLWEAVRKVPYSLAQLVQDMLAKDPKVRPSMEHVAERLAMVRLDESALSGLLRRRMRLLIAAGCAGLLVAAACGFALSLRKAPHESDRGLRSSTSVDLSPMPVQRTHAEDEKPQNDMSAPAEARGASVPTGTKPSTPGKHRLGGWSPKNLQQVAHPSGHITKPTESPARAPGSAVQPLRSVPPSSAPTKSPKKKVEIDDDAFY